MGALVSLIIVSGCCIILKISVVYKFEMFTFHKHFDFVNKIY
jgi:hypothetical protein